MALCVLFGLRKYHERKRGLPVRPIKFLRFLAFFLLEIIKANVKLIRAIFNPQQYILPGIIAFPLTCKKEHQRVWLANVITLTPGTLVIDMETHNNTLLFVHTMFLQSETAVIEEIKILENYIMEAIP